MNWKSIRLELAPTNEFPEGSASRAYLLRLPLDEEGMIDGNALGKSPTMATVHRHWPNEPDLSGYVVRTSDGWAMSYERGENDDENFFYLETHPIRISEYVTLTAPDNRRLPFKVVCLKPLD